MYTLKIKWMRFEKDDTNDGDAVVMVDESTLFIPADLVQIHGPVDNAGQMKSWKEGDFFDYHVEQVDGSWITARIIQVDRGDKSTWYLASHAWLLGPDGKTIERLT